jgi:phosphatidylserine/phosphatidylglycerophosphate/cardiolipin synthase-like enzyme
LQFLGGVLGVTPSKLAKVPREPWHDIHARVEGAAAYDLGMNFLQRWGRQAKLKRFVIAIDNHQGLLFPQSWRDYTVGGGKPVLVTCIASLIRTTEGITVFVLDSLSTIGCYKVVAFACMCGPISQLCN